MTNARSSCDSNLYRDKDKPMNICVKCACLACGLITVIVATYFGVVIFINEKPILVAAEAPSAEKLISPDSLQIETHQKLPPRPFGINILGPPPHEFTPSTTTAVPTTMRAPSMNYPQLTNYRHNYQPKNIQEILGYINKQRSYDVDVQENQNTERQSTNLEGFHRQNENSSSGFTSTDPFYPYKPTDPSDINLLATASFRFAPPVWKNFRKLYYQQTQQQSKHVPPSAAQQVETSNIQETFRNFVKPFVVTLNIVPMEDQYPSAAFNRYGQVVYPQSVTSQKYYGSSRTKLVGNRGNKMTIRLNVFPESITPFSGGQQEEQTAVSTVNKVKFV